MERLGVAGTDPLGEALGALEVRSSVFCLSDLGAPWGFRVEGAGIAKFHLVLEGAGWLRVDGHDPVPVVAGDVVLLLKGDEHAISDAPDSAVTRLEQLIAAHPLDDASRLRCGGSGARTRLLCGGFTVAGQGAAQLLGLVPDILHVDAQSAAATTWLAPVLTAMEIEMSHSPGAGAIQSKVAEVFVAQALRSWLIGAEQAGVLSAVLLSQDEAVAAAVGAVQRDVSARWTIEAMASTAGLSRTAFVTRFRTVVGDSPMRYVSRLRLSTAAGLLTTTRLSVHEVAVATGYDSDASLSKAFRRELGVPPGAYRDRARAEPTRIPEASRPRATGP